jgi:NAD(P)-dependent dehydrogenase (short-subunit alcohol dehydrogenase family)
MAGAVDLRLDGRAVIVTGGSSGIGRAIVELVAGRGGARRHLRPFRGKP